MTAQIWISTALQIFGTIVLGLFLKNYLPNYIGEKGKNLATKEDIAEITRKSEEVQDEFRREYEKFNIDLNFKYDFYYKQLTELYTQLYAIICQSEYLRRFFLLLNGSKLEFDDAPFIEIHKTTSTSTLKAHNTISNVKQEIKHDEITGFCKKEIVDLIIKKGEFASQKLLKLAVAYRFAFDNYSGSKTSSNSDIVKVADNEEIALITEIVKTIIREFNILRKELRIEYIEKEIEEGLFENVVINIED